MNNDVLKAILSMDAYNRGYNAAIDLNIRDTNNEIIEDYQNNLVKIGKAELYLSQGFEAAQDIGFYGIAYQIKNGTTVEETVIAYRGTDEEFNAITNPFPDDFVHGYPVGAGQPDVDQAEMAFAFYQTIMTDIYGTGLNYNDSSVDISLT